MSNDNHNRRIAVLIDGDNAQAKLLEQMMEEVSKHGQVTIRRIYGDWTKSNMNSWKGLLNSHAVQPIQQFSYTRGKNSTDSAMIIDAMDILHGRLVDGFCIVSSDSDYTRLATRIREEGFFVMGLGQKKTPEPFVKACELFIFTENLDSDDEKPQKKKAADEDPKLTKKLKRAFNMVVEDDDSVSLSRIGDALRKIDPGFDVREYGQRSLAGLFRSLPRQFELDVSENGRKMSVRLTANKRR